MQKAVEVGKIVEGKVTGITKFGAFVELEGGTVGMVHISEVSATYVNDISEHLKDQQVVKVKVLSVGEDGKVSLSIKKAMPTQQFQRRENRPSNNDRAGSPRFNSGGNSGSSTYQNRNDGGRGSYQRNNSNGNSGGSGFSRGQGGGAPQAGKQSSFEDMLSKFMSSSDEKISDMKHEKNSRRGSHQKRARDYDD